MAKDDRPSWNRRRPARLRRPHRNAAARPWYADRLEQRSDTSERLPLGPYETSYDVTNGYAFDRVNEPG